MRQQLLSIDNRSTGCIVFRPICRSRFPKAVGNPVSWRRSVMSATRLGKYLLTTLAFFPLLQLLAVSAQRQTPITSCGTVINTPGQYYLANDLNCHDYEVAITIESTNVELDLDHHQITGPGAGSQASGGINVTRSARSNIL